MSTKKRKEVVLDFDTIELLELQAKKEGRKLKNYMEHILREKANDFQFSEDYKNKMDKTLTDFDKGAIKFTDWDTIKNKLKKNVI